MIVLANMKGPNIIEKKIRAKDNNIQHQPITILKLPTDILKTGKRKAARRH